eukprot:COSAG06_NODE_26078_length_622_cov_0.910134_2_plen_95_part_01
MPLFDQIYAIFQLCMLPCFVYQLCAIAGCKKGEKGFSELASAPAASEVSCERSRVSARAPPTLRSHSSGGGGGSHRGGGGGGGGGSGDCDCGGGN